MAPTAADELIAREQAFRRALDFRADRAYVEDTIAQPARHGSLPVWPQAVPAPAPGMAYIPDPREFGSLGYHFTPAERRELQTRMVMQAQGRELWAYASGLPDYAGMRLDHAAGGRLVFGFTDGVETHRRELLRRASHPARLDVVLAPVSQEDLEAQRSRIELDRGRLAAQGIRLWDTRTDWQTGRVVAGIEDPSAAAQAVLRAAYGDNVDVEAGAAPDPHHTGHGSYDARRDEYDEPVRGGIRLKFDIWYRTGYCSSAFVAYRRGTYPDYYVLSAGHCAGGYEGSGQGWVLWGGRRLNHVTSNSFEDGSYSDSAIVPIRSAVRSRWVYVQPDWRAWQIHSSIPAMSEQKGHVTCMAGVYNPGTLRAQNCGTIIDNNFIFFETDYGHWLRRFVQMAGSGYHCRDGDSGGAVYAGSQAWGIHYGATRGNCTYSRIAYALQAHRLTDVVTF